MKKFWKKDKHNEETMDATNFPADEPAVNDMESDAVENVPACDSKANGEQPANSVADSPHSSTKNDNGGKQQPAADVIDLRVMFRQIAKRWKIFAIVLPIVFVLACLHIFNVPRYYTTSTSLAPEVETSSMGGGLSSIASSFGFNLSDMETTDAITPLLYPDLMDDNKFVVDMFYFKVTTVNDSLSTDYYTYLTKHQQLAWSTKIMAAIKKRSADKPKSSRSAEIKPYYLSEVDNEVAEEIRKNISIKVDQKTGVITISSTAQDPVVCKTLADSVTMKLQQFITLYRTNKAKKDVDHYKHLMDEALKEYEKVRRKYAEVSDANQDIVLESVKSKLEDMENDMQLKYNQYTTYNSQYQASMAKLREKTPAFTLLKGASVPTKPAGPKRFLYALIVTFLVAFVMSVWIGRKEFGKIIA